MTKYAGCRVRHRTCDVQSPCKECEKNGRECVRLNVRFRNLVCPAGKISRADYDKYDFFFDGEQTWVDTSGSLDFVTGSDSSDDASPVGDIEHDVFDMVEVATESRPAMMEKTSATIVLGSTYHTPTGQAPNLDDDPSDYLIASKQMPDDPPNDLPLEDTPAHSSRRPSPPREKPASDTGTFSEGGPLLARKVALPVNSLQEAKLVQHFVTHLAPWVCINFQVPSD